MTKKRWDLVFADMLKKGDVIASNQLGENAMRIVTTPVHRRNPVTGITYTVMKAVSVADHDLLELIFDSSKAVRRKAGT